MKTYFPTVFHRIHLQGLDLSGFESEYSTSDTVSVFEYLNHIFMMSTSNHILSDMVDIIRIRIRIRPKI
jgi:hypothetical protein